MIHHSRDMHLVCGKNILLHSCSHLVRAAAETGVACSVEIVVEIVREMINVTSTLPPYEIRASIFCRIMMINTNARFMIMAMYRANVVALNMIHKYKNRLQL